MNISIYSSNAFYDQLKVMILSLLEHNNFEKHNIFVVTTDMKQSNIDKLNKILKRKYDQEVTLFKITDEMKSGFVDTERFSAAGFYKLYAFRFLPIKADRILCLDTDMIIRGSLKEYYYQDFEGKIIIGCNSVIDKNTKIHCDELNLQNVDSYINLGAVVFNVKPYLEKYDIEYYYNWYQEHKNEAKYLVQDILNVLFENDIKVCNSFEYNLQILWTRYDKSEIDRMKKETKIIHYIGPYKMSDYRYYIKPKIFYYETLKNHNLWGEYIKVRMATFLYSTYDRIKRKISK